MKNPCKNCEDRHHNCHACCEDYRDFVDERHQINQWRYQYNLISFDNEQTKHKIKNYYKRFK